MKGVPEGWEMTKLDNRSSSLVAAHRPRKFAVTGMMGRELVHASSDITAADGIVSGEIERQCTKTVSTDQFARRCFRRIR